MNDQTKKEYFEAEDNHASGRDINFTHGSGPEYLFVRSDKIILHLSSHH